MQTVKNSSVHTLDTALDVLRYSLAHANGVHKHASPHWYCLYRHTRPCRHGPALSPAEKLRVRRVHGRELRHVGHVNADLDQVPLAATRDRQHLLHVCQTLPRLHAKVRTSGGCGRNAEQLVGGRVERELARNVNKPVGNYGLGVRADGSRGTWGVDLTSDSVSMLATIVQGKNRGILLCLTLVGQAVLAAVGVSVRRVNDMTVLSVQTSKRAMRGSGGSWLLVLTGVVEMQR